jgi:hypothetical protein
VHVAVATLRPRSTFLNWRAEVSKAICTVLQSEIQVSTVAIVLDPSLLFTRPNTKRYAYPLFVTDNLNCQLIVVTVSCITGEQYDIGVRGRY